MKIKQIIRSLMVISILVTGLAAGQDSTQLLFRDNFHNGFLVGAPGDPEANWFFFTAGPFVGNDGVVRTGRHGLRVIPTGINPQTGQPAFVKTLAPENQNGGLPGTLDHVKWLAFANHQASTGFPGFDAVAEQEISCNAWMGGQTFGTQFHPFGNDVIDANNDLRLASVAQVALDFESFMVFDFFMTNEKIYVFYERLPFGRTGTNNYAAFSFMVPVANNNPGDIHHLRIAYNRSKGVVRWLIDGTEVYRVTRIGRLIDRAFMTLDLGGVEEDVSPRQLACGMGTFTLLDGFLPSGIGLVRISEQSYFNPLNGKPVTDSFFFDNQSSPSNRIFGQGAELAVRRYTVSNRDVGRRNDVDSDIANDSESRRATYWPTSSWTGRPRPIQLFTSGRGHLSLFPPDQVKATLKPRE
jgi:uncharacterized protein DUF6081